MREKKCDVCGTVIPEHDAPYPHLLYSYWKDEKTDGSCTNIDFCSKCAAKVIQCVNNIIIVEKAKLSTHDEPMQQKKKRFRLFKK